MRKSRNHNVYTIGYCFQGPFQGPLYIPKNEENQIRMILPISHWEGGHMTNYQKW